MFGIFRADIHVVDTVKKAVLSQLLLESVVSTRPGENLDEKLSMIALPSTIDKREFFCLKLSTLSKCSLVLAPSTDEKAWWDTSGENAILLILDTA